MTMTAREQTREWTRVCAREEILPNTGVCCLVAGKQVALFRLVHGAHEQLFAISNYDPFSKANVLSRGIVGDRAGRPKVASPIYKQSFCLETGACLDDPGVSLPSYPVRVVDGFVEVMEPLTRTLRAGNTALLSEIQTA